MEKSVVVFIPGTEGWEDNATIVLISEDFGAVNVRFIGEGHQMTIRCDAETLCAALRSVMANED